MLPVPDSWLSQSVVASICRELYIAVSMEEGRKMMRKKMQPKVHYKVGHPLLEKIRIVDGYVYPGSGPGGSGGYIGVKGVGPRFEGDLHLSGVTGCENLRHLEGKIQIRGLLAVFPDNSEYEIYVEGTEPPSGRIGREKAIEATLFKFNEDVKATLGLFSGALGEKFNEDGRATLIKLFGLLGARATSDFASAKLGGIIYGLQLAGLLSSAEIANVRTLFKSIGEKRLELSVLGYRD